MTRTRFAAGMAALGTLVAHGTTQAQRARVVSIRIAPAAARDSAAPRYAAALRDSAAPRQAGDDRELRSIIVSNAAPKSFRVVSVPVPAEVAGTKAVAYEVVGAGTVSLLGAPSGTLPPSGSVVLTIGVPGSAGAGLTRAGFVRFTAAGAQPVRVPIDVDVTRIAHLEMLAVQPMRGALPGDRVELAFSVLNGGNLADTLDLQVEAPETWNARLTASAHLVLQRGESIERTVAASIPIAADLGDGVLSLVARARSGERAAATMIVEITDPTRAARRSGPVVTIGAASAMSAGVPTRSVESVALDGPLSNDLNVSGRFSTAVSTDPIDGRALSTLGYSAQANYLSLGAQYWAATVGATGIALNDLAGQNVFGRGAAVRIGAGDDRLQLLGASPFVADGASPSPSLFVGSAQHGLGPGVFTAFFSHLRDSSYLVRDVDAAGAGFEARPWDNALVSGAVADRSSTNGSGLGAEVDVRGPIAGGDLAFRATHAPGGASAFAPARDLVSVGADRPIGRLRADGSYWSTHDANSLSAIGSSGWSVDPTYAVLPQLTFGLTAMQSSVTSSDSTSGFASSQRDFGVRARFLHAGFDIGADTRWSSLSQSVTQSGQRFDEDPSQRITNRLRVDHVGARGAFGIGGSLENALIGGFGTPRQTTYDAHVDRYQFWPRFPRWTVSGSAQRLQVGDIAVVTSRAELDVEVQRAFRIVLGAERGTARDAVGALHTIVTLKVERSSSVSGFDRSSLTGVVFQDRNGNGIRDRGEPGVPGIVVHRGAETAVTDGNGVYRLNAAGSGRPEVDNRSLPKGWLQSPRLLDRPTDGLDLGVVPVTSVDVRIDLAPTSDGTMPDVRIGTATFALRDSAGREWVARSDASLRAVFDALPLGRYTLTMELDGSSEPLTIDPIPPIDVVSATGRQHVVITVHTRPVRIFRSRQINEHGQSGNEKRQDDKQSDKQSDKRQNERSRQHDDGRDRSDG